MKQEFDKAIADCNEAIQLDPKHATAVARRGYAFFGRQEYAKAIADLKEAARLAPDSPRIFAVLAQCFSDCPDDSIRDLAKGMEYATKANDLAGGKDAVILEVLADVYHEISNPSKAVEWQK